MTYRPTTMSTFQKRMLKRALLAFYNYNITFCFPSNYVIFDFKVSEELVTYVRTVYSLLISSETLIILFLFQSVSLVLSPMGEFFTSYGNRCPISTPSNSITTYL